jgi:hypothetical protein
MNTVIKLIFAFFLICFSISVNFLYAEDIEYSYKLDTGNSSWYDDFEKDKKQGEWSTTEGNNWFDLGFEYKISVYDEKAEEEEDKIKIIKLTEAMLYFRNDNETAIKLSDKDKDWELEIVPVMNIRANVDTMYYKRVPEFLDNEKNVDCVRFHIDSYYPDKGQMKLFVTIYKDGEIRFDNWEKNVSLKNIFLYGYSYIELKKSGENKTIFKTFSLDKWCSSVDIAHRLFPNVNALHITNGSSAGTLVNLDDKGSIQNEWKFIADSRTGEFSEILAESVSDKFRFAGWLGDIFPGREKENPLIVKSDESREIDAKFILIKEQLVKFSTESRSKGYVDGEKEQVVQFGEHTENVTAVPSSDYDYEFSEWQILNITDEETGKGKWIYYSSNNPLTIEDVQEDMIIRATFNKKDGDEKLASSQYL